MFFSEKFIKFTENRPWCPKFVTPRVINHVSLITEIDIKETFTPLIK